MKKLFTITIATLFVGLACGGTIKSPKPPDAPSCGNACSRMKALGCPEGQDLANAQGEIISCEDWCEYTISELHVPLNALCVSSITNCIQIETTCAVGKAR